MRAGSGSQRASGSAGSNSRSSSNPVDADVDQIADANLLRPAASPSRLVVLSASPAALDDKSPQPTSKYILSTFRHPETGSVAILVIAWPARATPSGRPANTGPSDRRGLPGLGSRRVNTHCRVPAALSPLPRVDRNAATGSRIAAPVR